MNKPLDELRQRLQSRSTDQREVVVKVEAVKATKPKEPKPMSNRTTKNNTGLEHYTNAQLAAKHDRATTMQEAYRCQLEMQNRLGKYRETYGHLFLEEINRLEVENGPLCEPEPDPEEPEPVYTTPPRSPEPLTWDIIVAIEQDQCEYGPYIKEIYESDWDYVDRRPNNVHMRADQWTAKDFVISHKDDVNCTRSSLSDSQYGIMIVLLKAYYGHKRHPEWQARENNAPF